MPEEPPTTPSGDATGPRSPNYAARRMLVSTIGITAVVAAGVLGWRVIRGDDGLVAGRGGDWDAIALVDRSTGAVDVVDTDGNPEEADYAGRGRVNSVEADGARLAMVGTDQLVLTDLEAEPTIIPFERTSTVTRLATSDGLDLVIGNPMGGNVVVVDGDTGTTIDVGALANQSTPLLFADTVRYDLEGTVFAVADAANFQTIVVRAGADQPVFYPDQPLAVSNDLVATSQVVGTRADIGLFDAEGERLNEAPAPIPAGGAIVDGELIFVSVDGGVFRFRRDGDEALRIGNVTVPAGGIVRSARLSHGGDRLVVYGDVFQAIVDLQGNVLFTTTFTTAVDVTTPDPEWDCLPVGSRESAHSLRALDDGAQLADLTGLALTGTSADGCAVIGERAGVTEVVSADGVVQIGRVRAASLGPDGRAVVVHTTTGRIELSKISDERTLGSTVDLTELAPTNPIVAFLDR